MSLVYVILGLLQQKQQTGYDLKTQCFDDCIAYLWQADQAQIYRTLDRLESQGWIVCTIEIQRDRPNRKVYQITLAGEAALAKWLQTHQPLPTLREPLLVQLHFSAQLSNQAIIELLQQEEEARREKLSQCEAVLASLTSALTTTPREQTMQQLVLELIQQREQTYLTWISRAIETIRQAE